MRIHIIIDGVVANTILADSIQQAEAIFPGATCIEAVTGGPGWIYSNGQLVQPAPALATRHVTRLAFRNRFTQAEKVTIEMASRAATADGAGIKVYLDDVAAATYIDLDRADTRAGVQALETAGILAQGRALEILDDEIQAHEIPE